MSRLPRLLPLFAVLSMVAPEALAFSFATDETDDYLLIGRVDMGIAEAVNVGSSNSLGRLYSVPSGSNPDVDDNPPWPLPAGGTAPVEGISNDGNVAITNPNGSYAFSDIDIWADIGIVCHSDVLGDCRDTWSNSNLYNGTTAPFPAGTFANDPTGMNAIETELVAAATAIGMLSATGGWSVSGDGSKNGDDEWEMAGGLVDSNTTITLASGQNVIVIDNNGSDFSLNNAGLVITGEADSSVIFLLKDESKNFLFTNASVTIGGDMSTDSVLFAMLDGGNDTNFGFSKVILNGAAFWDLSLDGGEISMDNVQGCTQLVGDKLGLQDVQLSRCAAGVPEPGTAPLAGASLLALLGMGAWLRRRS